MDHHRRAEALPTLQPAPASESGSKSRTPDEGSSRASRGRRIACKSCRQAKLRCDGLRSGVGPCVRCSRLQLECYIDAEYKRVNKKSKLNELEEQVQQLRQAVDRGGQLLDSGVEPAGIEPIVVGNGSEEPHPSLFPETVSTASTFCIPPPNFPEDSETEAVQPLPREILTGMLVMARSPEPTTPYLLHNSSSRSINHITLTNSQVRHLFKSFFDHYHPFLEILGSSLTPDDCYAKSPALFWVIIGIASRTYDQDPDLVISLSSCVPNVLWSCITKPPHKRYSIQAMLLLSLWPFPTSSTSSDPAFMLTSIAKASSMQLGLHRPATAQDSLVGKTDLNTQRFQEAVTIWAGCYITAQSLTTSTGHQSLFTKDWVIDQACEPGNQYTLPDNLRYNLLVARFTAKVNRLMADDESSLTSRPAERSERNIVMTMLEHDLIDLEHQINNCIESNDKHTILLTMARLQLLTHYFFMTAHSEQRKKGLLRGYAAAIGLITKVSHADSEWNYTRLAPIPHHQMLSMAALFLIKIINSSYSKYVDVDEGKIAFNKALALLRGASIKPDDLRAQASNILAQLWSVHESAAAKREMEPCLSIKTRLGANFLYDALHTWREYFGSQHGESQSHDLPTNTSMHQANQNHLNSEVTEQRTSAPQSETLPEEATSANPSSFASTCNLNIGLQDTPVMWDLGLQPLLPIHLDS